MARIEQSSELNLKDFSIESSEAEAVDFLAPRRLRDSGLSSLEWQTVRKGLSKLQEQPDYPIQNEEILKELIDEQEQLAKLRETQNLLKEVKQKAAKKDFFKGAIRAVPFAAFLGLSVLSVNLVNDYYSPAAVSQRAVDNARNQAANKAAAAEIKKQQDEKAKQEKINFEATHVLGLEPTAFSALYSSDEWRVRYNPLNPTVKYAESGTTNDYHSVDPKGEVNFPGNINFQHSYIFVNSYTKLDGTVATTLNVQLDSKNLQSWILRDTPSDNIDTSVVIFEDVIHHREFPVKINMVQTDNSTKFQLFLMKKVPANQS